MKKLIYVLVLAWVSFIALPNAARAQVKIGANAKTIGTNSNLEVEATNGKKTIVDKATGQVTIQDGTEGAGKVLTSDATGGSRWVANIVTGGTIKINTPQTFVNSNNNPSAGANILATPSPINITAAGNYSVSLRWWGVTPSVTTPSNNQNTTAGVAGSISAYITLLKNGVKADEIEYYLTAQPSAAFSFNVNLLAPSCVSGDVLTIQIVPSTGLGNWLTGTVSNGANPTFMPSLVVLKL